MQNQIKELLKKYQPDTKINPEGGGQPKIATATHQGPNQHFGGEK